MELVKILEKLRNGVLVTKDILRNHFPNHQPQVQLMVLPSLFEPTNGEERPPITQEFGSAAAAADFPLLLDKELVRVDVLKVTRSFP